MARVEGAKEMSGEERWRRGGASESLRGRRSEDMTQSNTSSPRGSEVSFESQRGQLKSPRMKRFLGKRRNQLCHSMGRSE